MRRRYQLLSLLSWFSLFGSEGDPLFEKSSDRVLISELRNIVLSTERIESNLLSNPAESIRFIELDIPGGRKNLVEKLTPFLAKEVKSETLKEIKQAIAMHYRSSYHPFVLVSTPEQDVTDGVLQLMIQESRLGEVRVEGNRWSSDAKLQEYIQLSPGDAIDESYLIKNVSFINRNPFRRVDLVFMAGSSPGTTDVVLATKDRFPIRLYTGTDNTGVQPTGEGRWYTGFNWGQAFGLDHVFSYQFSSDWSLKKFHAHTFEYTALLSWGHLLEVYGGYSKVHPTVSYPLRSNDGWSFQTSGRYVIPLKIYRYLEQDVTVGGDFKRTNNTFEFTENFPTTGSNVNLTQLVFGYKGNYERNNFRFDFKGNVFWSPGEWIGDQSNADYATLRPDAVNHWFYLRGAFSYLQRLPKSFSFFFLAEGQVSTQPLLPSEQFGLGGYDTVRGYEEREVNKDNALLLSLEFRSPGLPALQKTKTFRNVSDAIQFLGFLDYGWGINLDPIPHNQIADFLIGIGPGVRYTLEPYLTARLDWGIRLHNKVAYAGGTSMFHFNATASY